MSKTEKITSPKGKLEWVTISGEGKENLSGKMQYVASVVVEQNCELIKKIEDFWEDNKPPKYKKEPKSLGIYDHLLDTGEKDEDGKPVYEPDGKKVLTFKTGVVFPDGKSKKVQVYNAKARKVELPEGVLIGNDSIGRISGAMGLYTNTTKRGDIVDAGVTLYLDSIQLITLVEYTSDPGFEEEEEENSWTGEEEWTGEETEETQETQETESRPRL